MTEKIEGINATIYPLERMLADVANAEAPPLDAVVVVALDEAGSPRFWMRNMSDQKLALLQVAFQRFASETIFGEGIF